MSRKVCLLAAVLLVALFAGACSRMSGPSDQEIVSAIQAKLYQNPDLKTLSVNVVSEKGVVTLSGAVNAPLEKLAVEDLAEKTPGVKQVVDQLTVAAAQEASQPAPSAPAHPASEEKEATARRPRRHRARHAARISDSDADSPRPEVAQNEPPAAPAAPGDSPAAVAPAPSPTPAPQAQPAAAPSAPVPAPAPAPPKPVHVTIPSGTVFSISMIDPITSETAHAGETYGGTLFAPVVVGQRVVIPRGADAKVRVVEVHSAGHYQGQSELQVELVSVSINGIDTPVQTGYYTKLGTSRGRNTAEKVGGGAALGALLGALIGHGKGAGIGAGIGGAAGGIDQAATHGQQVTIPAEARIDFVLRGPVTVTEKPVQ